MEKLVKKQQKDCDERHSKRVESKTTRDKDQEQKEEAKRQIDQE